MDLFLNFENILHEMTKINTLVAVILGDFNAKCITWCNSDKNMLKGTLIYCLTSCPGFRQLIQEPTHKILNSASFIDMTFTSHPNLVFDCGVCSFLHPTVIIR